MPRKLFKRLVPRPDSVKKQGALKAALGDAIHDPNLWHLNKHAVAKAFAVGLFTAFFPIPGQMIIAGLFALFVRANLPISVALVWISNPVTIPPMFYATYRLGAWMLGEPALSLEFEFSWEWLQDQLEDIWLPLITGCLTAGIVTAGLSYLLVRYFWRWHVIQAWNARKEARAIKRAEKGCLSKQADSDKKSDKEE